MSTTTHNPAGPISLQHDAATIGRSPRAAHAFAWAQAANHALLDVCPRCVFVAELHRASTYSCGYTPSTHARWLWVEWVEPPADVKTGAWSIPSSTCALTIRDTSGGSWTAGRPTGFAGEQTDSVIFDGVSRFTRETRREGWIDLDVVRGALTGTNWTLELVTTTGLYLSRFLAWECPRFTVDDTVTGVGGVVPGGFAPHAPIVAGPVVGSPAGLQRVLATIEAARQVGRTYLSLTWPEDTAATIPQVTSTSQTYLTNLDVAGSTYATWKIRVRRLYTAAVAGEAIRWRVRYRFAGGTVETATVYLHTGATGTPWSVTLSYTASWTWSAWQTTALVPTNGTGTVATLGIEAKVSAGGPTFYLAGLQVEETPT